MTDPITGTSGTNGMVPPAVTTPTNELGKDAFLKLLVAQLKYQDPLNPVQGAEFLAQSAQFTMVEKLTELTDASTVSMANQQALAASSLIGKEVSWVEDDALRTGAVSGVRFTTTGPSLVVGAAEVPLTSITQIHQPTTPAPAA